ncbi:MAG TPA: polysaccharide deacetylase family protein [Candidatus Limnocylindria bacterium]|nr:polysaccharide deacetylase family protein [Candidatus Limnocylindria bacterium]
MTALRSVARRIVDSAPFGHALRVLDRMDRGQRDLLGVLTYHRIADPDAASGHPGIVSATPSQFVEQLDFVRGRYRVVSLHDVLEARDHGMPLPPRAVLITFDDAYRDFADAAWPMLRSRDLPATLFVPTAFPGSPSQGFWWDWLHEAVMAAPDGAALRTAWTSLRLPSREQRPGLLRELRTELKGQPHETLLAEVRAIGEQLGVPPPAGQVLGWEELRSLAADGVTLAPHSRTHPLLDRIDPDRLGDELSGAIADLEEHVGPTPRALAYPSGSHSAAVRDAVRSTGYALAFTTQRGLNRLGRTDWFAMRRINVGRSSSLNAIGMQLGRWAVAWSR